MSIDSKNWIQGDYIKLNIKIIKQCGLNGAFIHAFMSLDPNKTTWNEDEIAAVFDAYIPDEE